jgi:serine/threonine-protein kinase
MNPHGQSAGDLPTVGAELAAHPAASSAGVVGRYAVRALHARGGLGEVYVATDTELNREVALKRIQDRYADQARSRRRFLAEAEVTARLEHPGVVPVFGLVADPAGRPCYAMRFVRGDTLLDQIAAHHASADPAGKARGLRQLLGRFQAVCQAVAYAHSKDVVHRDLKPANVMVGSFGETLVVDWGLAKEVGSADDPAAGVSGVASGTVDGGGAETDGGTASVADAGTRAGAVVGTPAYMPPEQAAGRADEVGPLSDVYALGATLYHLLTGRAPVTGGTDRAELLGRVERGEFPRPREVNGGVPKALEAVCLKAMAARPADRYGSAGALAEDVDRWLADDPVSAYRDPWTKRVARWAKRHRVLVNSVGAALLIGAVAFGVGFWHVKEALGRETTARQKADLRFAQARDAVNRYFVTVAEDERLKAEDLQPLRGKLLADAQDYFQDFRKENESDPDLRAAVASSYLRTGLIEHELLARDPSRAAYQEGIARYEQLLAERPGERSWIVDLAGGHVGFGNLQTVGAGTRSAARASYQRALDLVEPVAAEGDRSARRVLARVCDRLGEWHKGENAEQALAYCQRAVDLREGLLAEADDKAVRFELATSLGNLATLHVEGRLKAAKATYEAARGQWQKLSQVGLAGAAARQAEGRTLHDLGIIHARLGDPKAAAAARAEALRVREGIVYDHGRAYLRDLARTLNDYGLQLNEEGGPAKADGLRMVAEARRHREKLVAAAVSALDLTLLAESHNNEANLAIGDGRLDDADAALRRGRAVLDRAPADQQETVDVATHRGLNLHLLGYLHIRRKEFDKAHAALDQARAVRARLVENDPTRTQHQLDLAFTCVMLGNVALRSDERAAIDWYGKAREIGDRLAKFSPEDIAVRASHAVNTYSLANARHRAGDKPEEVAAVLAEAIATGRAVVDEVPALPGPRLVLGLGYRLLAEVRRKQGDAAAAAAAARDRRDLYPDDPAKLAEVAADLAQCAPLVPDGPDQAASQKRYADEAVAALTRAIEKGFRDAAALAKPPFAPLRDRPDFKTLLTKLEASPLGK